ncbi:sugar ABC transporter permease [Acrocarpospora pleiomorpha]|uniref:Sugar ABC transporter permease n=1 Tax=Acrocarpospora pleiomorpha TaxID=90975 RepID=A0A5M3XHL1_9ACTN|nr:sugar ABC transporter permease [Acrocarpospora pleiomorpha]
MTTSVARAKPLQRSFAEKLALDRFSGVLVLAVLVVIFGTALPDTFLTATTLKAVSQNQAVTFMAALALILPLAAGIFDLSVAATLGVAVVLSLKLIEGGTPVVLAILATFGVGLVIGVVNGVVIVGLQVSSFIATLGMSSVLAAIAYWITDGNQLVGTNDNAHSFTKLGQGTLVGLAYPVWYAVVVAIIIWYVTEATTVGRYLYGIGGNSEAARLAGVRVNLISFGSLVASGLIASFAGVVLSAQLGTGGPDIGTPYLLPAFSTVLLGATQVRNNGRVNVLGTLVACVLLATGIYGLQLAGAPSWISSLFNGCALILAVALSVRLTRRR